MIEICRHGTIARKCETCEAWADAAELRAELAKVTAERDEARRELDRALLDMAAGFAGITPGAE